MWYAKLKLESLDADIYTMSPEEMVMLQFIAIMLDLELKNVYVAFCLKVGYLKTHENIKSLDQSGIHQR